MPASRLRFSCHSFWATGLTVYLENKGTVETVQKIARSRIPYMQTSSDRFRELVARRLQDSPQAIAEQPEQPQRLSRTPEFGNPSNYTRRQIIFFPFLQLATHLLYRRRKRPRKTDEAATA